MLPIGVYYICWGACALAGLLTLLGLIRPWWVLWWHATSYRMKVLRYYGLPFVGLLLLCLLLH